MPRPIFSRSSKISLAFVALMALPLADCSSPEARAQSYYDSGMKLLAAHEDQKAAVEFRNALRLKKDFLPAWRGLAQTEETAHDWAGLVPVLRTVLDLDTSDQATRLKLAKLLLSAGNPAEALKLVNASTEPDTNNAGLLALKAVISYKLKDSDTAVRDAQAALKLEPGNVDALIVLAAVRFDINDSTGALKILSSSPQTQDKDLGTQLYKLKIYGQLKDYGQTEALLKTLAERYPQNLGFRKQLVSIYVTQHRTDDAEKELRAIAAIDPNNAQSGLDLVQFLYRFKSPAAGRQELMSRINAGGDVFSYQLALAGFDYDQGNVGDSLKLLEQLSRSEPPAQSAKAKIMLAELNLRQKNVAAAEKLIDDILANDQRNVDALRIRATIHLDRNQIDPAVADLREGLNDQPRSADLMLMLATAYERSGSIDLADKEYADAMKASNFNPLIGLQYVAFLRRRGGNDRSYDVLSELANRWPNNVQVLSSLAEAKLSRQDWAGAQQIAELIKRIDNSGRAADEILGAALSGEHKYDASIAAFQSAAAAAPSAAAPMADLVRVLVTNNQTDKATAYLQSVLKDNPKNAQAYVLLGNIQFSNHTPDRAESSFKAAIAGQPTNEVGYQALANLYLRQDKVDAALEIIQSGLTKMPDSANLLLTRASIFERQGNYDAAISEYQNMLKSQPGSMIITNNLASLLADHRTDKASLDQAQSLASSLRDSPVPQFQDTLGWVYNRQGNFNASVPLLEKAAASMPTSALVHYHLGMSYAGAGQIAKSSDQLKQALSQTTDSSLQAKIQAGMKTIATQ